MNVNGEWQQLLLLEARRINVGATYFQNKTARDDGQL